MYGDDILRIPASEQEMWEIFDDHFEHARYVLEDVPVQTQEQALEAPARGPMSVIRYRKTSPDYDQRDYYLKIGRELLDEVEAAVAARRLSPRFVQQWGKLMFCHGYIASYYLEDTDEHVNQRAAIKNAQKHRKTGQRIWVARVLQEVLPMTTDRKRAEREVARRAQAFADAGGFGASYPPSWFEAMLGTKGHLKTTYGQRQLFGEGLRDWANKDEPGLPPLIP